MCGIFFYLGINNTSSKIYHEFMKSKSRGPDNSRVIIEKNIFIGFHRLMINDLTYNGDQPMFHNENILICNGEIYNSQEIIEKYDLQCKSKSDCEVIIQLYDYLKKYNNQEKSIKILCEELDGEFAFIIYDKSLEQIIIARDRYGVRPLFIGNNKDTNEWGFASELKNLNLLFDNIIQFNPSSYSIINININDKNNNNVKSLSFDMHTYNNIYEPYNLLNDCEDIILPQIKEALEKAVEKRLSGEMPICALLSGGLDSSLVCGIITKKIGKGILNTFSIGLEGSTDLLYAKKVAEHIGSIHHEIKVTEKEMLESIEEVIRIIESYDITTVRASTPHYLISKYIKENTEFKCVISGEMSDEQMSSYFYFKKAPDIDSMHNESNRLIKDICYFDNLRADKCISSQGLEARIPFSDHHLIKLIQSINPKLRMCDTKIEKYLLRKAFDNIDLIPDSVLWRPKAGFSDAVSSYENSWHKIIKKHVDSLISDEEFEIDSIQFSHCIPYTKEAYYYRKLFHKYYDNHYNIVPYFWLPKWCYNKQGQEITDPSARELTDIYIE